MGLIDLLVIFLPKFRLYEADTLSAALILVLFPQSGFSETIIFYLLVFIYSSLRSSQTLPNTKAL